MSSFVNYDDYKIFTPEGKIKPLDNIKNSVELGMLSLGIVGGEEGVLMGYTGNCDYPVSKIFRVDGSNIFSYAGITNDGLALRDYLLGKSVREEVIKDRQIDPLKVFEKYSYFSSVNTVYLSKRINGASGLLLSKNKKKVVLVEVDPVGNVYDCKATAIGKRSQSAKTILEKYVDEYPQADCNRKILIGVEAIKNTLEKEEPVNHNTLNVWIITKNEVKELSKEELKNILS